LKIAPIYFAKDLNLFSFNKYFFFGNLNMCPKGTSQHDPINYLDERE